MKIAQIAKSSHNIGEGALIDGLRHTLNSDLKEECNFTYFDRKLFQRMAGQEFSSNDHSLRFDNAFTSHLNQNYQLLILGGGGILQTGCYPNLGGLVLDGDLSALHDLKIPWVVYGAGDNRFSEQQEFQYINEFQQLIDISTKSANSIVSMRNDLSKERFSQLLPSSFCDLIETVPDTGLYVSATKDPHPLINPEKCNIVIQLAGDRVTQRLQHYDTDDKGYSFLHDLAQSCLQISSSLDVNFILAPHIPTDFGIISDFVDICSKISWKGSGLIRELFDVSFCTRGYSQAPRFFSLYDQADLAIGMRGHASICSVGLRTPFISINTHPKVRGFMQSMDLSHYMIDPLVNDVPNDLTSLALSLILDPSDWYNKRDSAYLSCRQKTLEFHQRIGELIS